MKKFYLFTFLLLAINCLGQSSKKIVNTNQPKVKPNIVVGLPNETLKALLNACYKSCINGDKFIAAIALKNYLFRFVAPRTEVAEQYLIVEYNEWMRDKLFLSLYHPSDDYMKTVFYTIGIDQANSNVLTQFLQNNISTIRERNIKYEESLINDSFGFSFSKMVDKYPEFISAKSAGKFIADSLKYPEQALRNNIGGKITVEFIIDYSGAPIDIKVKEGRQIGYGLPEEAMRLVQLMKFKPAIKDNAIVEIEATKEILFKPNK